MRILKVKAKNFQSYRDIEFDYSELGLCLLSGDTKAGKSSILDLCSWTLYGETSKDSNADDIRSWFCNEETTSSKIDVECPDGKFSVVRVRGTSHENDLYLEENNNKVRGKDQKDTQKMIADRLGMDFNSFLLSSYLHQFSKIDVFFTAKAKDRRDIFEQVADLSSAILLADKSSEKRKLEKQEIELLKKELHGLNSQLNVYNDQRSKTSNSNHQWLLDKDAKLRDLKDKFINFEDNRKKEIFDIVSKVELLSKEVKSQEEIDKNKESVKVQIKAFQTVKNELKIQSKVVSDLDKKLEILSSKYKEYTNIGEVCPLCLNNADNHNLHNKIKEIELQLEETAQILDKEMIKKNNLEKVIESEDKVLKLYDKMQELELSNSKMQSDLNAYNNKLIILRSTENTYEKQIAQLENEISPFTKQLLDLDQKIDITQFDINSTTNNIKECEEYLAAYNYIYNKSFEMRGYLLDQTRQEIQNKTNELLSTHFDGNLSINLYFEDSDKLQIEIQNNGNKCPYKQLSGGERCMLRLCFYLALSTKVQESKGTHVNCIMLDEALNGLNPALKIKTFSLLQSLLNKHESIIVIDHEEQFKAMFNKIFSVTNTGGLSEVSEI